MRLPYIVFEGIVGSGKSTQSKMLAKFLREEYNKLVLWTKEPGGTEISDVIRKVVQGTRFDEHMDYITEAYLYAASRAQSKRLVVKPFIDRGGVVVSDRCEFTSYTNQAYGRELGLKTVMDINKVAVGDIVPGLIVYVKVPIALGLSRTSDQRGDKFEAEPPEFYERVIRGYEELSVIPGIRERWVTIEGNRSKTAVFNDVKKAAIEFLREIKYL